MESINNIWQKHLYIEYRLGKVKNGDSIMINESAWKNKLWEEHGVMPNMDRYADAICNFVKNYLETNSYGQHSFVANEDVFNIPTFFDKCSISFEINYSKAPIETEYGGGYFSGLSGWKNDDGEYYYVQIRVFAESNDINDILYCVRHTFIHELTHAYDDYGRNRTRKIGDEYRVSGDNLFTASNKSGQYKASEMSADANDYISTLGEIIYRTANSEINASIGAFKAELLQKMIGTNSSKDAMSVIKTTELYHEVKYIKDCMEGILLIRNHPKHFGDIQKILISSFNVMKHHEDWESLLGVTKDITISNFDQLYRYLQKRVRRYERRIITQTSKIAYDVYCQVGDKGTDNKILKNR